MVCAELALADYFSFLFSCFFAHYLPFLSFLFLSRTRRVRACVRAVGLIACQKQAGGFLVISASL